MRGSKPSNRFREGLAETGRNVATNLAHHTGKSRKRCNGRLPVLADYSLVRKVGPAERSGLYELTPRGAAALAHRDRYGQVDDFEGLLEGAEIDAGTEPRFDEESEPDEEPPVDEEPSADGRTAIDAVRGVLHGASADGSCVE